MQNPLESQCKTPIKARPRIFGSPLDTLPGGPPLSKTRGYKADELQYLSPQRCPRYGTWGALHTVSGSFEEVGSTVLQIDAQNSSSSSAMLCSVVQQKYALLERKW